MQGFPEFPQNLVLIVEHADIARALIFRDLFFDPYVLFQRVMPVQMVRRDVQDRADLRREGLDRLLISATVTA